MRILKELAICLGLHLLMVLECIVPISIFLMFCVGWPMLIWYGMNK